MPEGPLGFPRLTSIGPLSERTTSEKIQKIWQPAAITEVDLANKLEVEPPGFMAWDMIGRPVIHNTHGNYGGLEEGRESSIEVHSVFADLNASKGGRYTDAYVHSIAHEFAHSLHYGGEIDANIQKAIDSGLIELGEIYSHKDGKSPDSAEELKRMLIEEEESERDGGSGTEEHVDKVQEQFSNNLAQNYTGQSDDYIRSVIEDVFSVMKEYYNGDRGDIPDILIPIEFHGNRVVIDGGKAYGVEFGVDETIDVAE